MRRRNNQDSFAVVIAEDEISWQKSGHLLIVADGMGAHAAGELASRLSVELIPHHYGKLLKGIPSEALQRSLIETNSEIFRRGQANPEFRSMGTTTCALAILPEGAVVAHVGDSRVYRLRGNQFEQLTFDHSLVWEMQHKIPDDNVSLSTATTKRGRGTNKVSHRYARLRGLHHPTQLRQHDRQADRGGRHTRRRSGASLWSHERHACLARL